MVAVQLDEPGDGNVNDMPLGPECRHVDRRPDGNGLVIFGCPVAAEQRFRRFQGQVLLVVVLPITLVEAPACRRWSRSACPFRSRASTAWRRPRARRRSRVIEPANAHRIAAVEIADDLPQEPVGVLEVPVLGGPEQLERRSWTLPLASV